MHKIRPSRFFLSSILFLFLLPSLLVKASTTYQELVGFDLLPEGVDGSGILFGLVEADQRPNDPAQVRYRSDHSDIDFVYEDLDEGGVDYATPSNHANTVMARYANAATGVTDAVNTEAFYFFNQYLDLVLSGYPSPTLAEPVSDVINMSFRFGTTDDGLDRRVDFLSSEWNKVVVAGASTNSGVIASPASAYNVISVAELSNDFSGPRRTEIGPTDGSTPGRANPHLLAPGTTTSAGSGSQPSWAAPVVSAAAAVLLQVARENPALAAADDARLVKSILLTGANKLSGWEADASDKVLDVDQGAGVVDVAKSHNILVGGQTTASTSDAYGVTGWDVASVVRTVGGAPGGGTDPTASWFFDVPAEGNFLLGFDIAATLAWNRQITSDLSSTLRELHLSLYAVDEDSFTIGDLIYASTSGIDNLQHIFRSFSGEEAGRFALVVDGISFDNNEMEEFAVSWNVQAIPEPSAYAFLIGLMVIFTRVFWRRFQ